MKYIQNEQSKSSIRDIIDSKIEKKIKTALYNCENRNETNTSFGAYFAFRQTAKLPMPKFRKRPTFSQKLSSAFNFEPCPYFECAAINLHNFPTAHCLSSFCAFETSLTCISMCWFSIFQSPLKSKEDNRIIILDGGFSSQLCCHLGEVVDGDPLWSARFLATNPHDVINTHLDFLRGKNCSVYHFISSKLTVK